MVALPRTLSPIVIPFLNKSGAAYRFFVDLICLAFWESGYDGHAKSGRSTLSLLSRTSKSLAANPQIARADFVSVGPSYYDSHELERIILFVNSSAFSRSFYIRWVSK